MPAAIELTGQRFGRLVVLRRAGSDRHGSALWLCRCDCGKEVVVRGSDLRSGNTQSCGCLNRECAAERCRNRTAHGHARRGERSRAHRCWGGMMKRCNNPHDKAYPRYGGRGIKVCERWWDYEKFWKDMGDPPKGYQIDRIDNDGDYEPGNCRWVTRSENQRNKRNNHLITFRGKTQCLKAWAEEVGIAAGTIQWRAARGWSVERALTEPAKRAGAR